jgi:hypothetical protein
MALITSHTGHEALNFKVGDMQYHRYTGGFYLEIICSLLNPALPKEAHEIGEVLAGTDLAKSLREFDFSGDVFDYAHNFNWENDGDNAGWRIGKTAERGTVDVEFVFLRTFWWGNEEMDPEDQLVIVGDIEWYAHPIHATQADFPSLKLALSPHNPRKRNGIISLVDSFQVDDIAQIVASHQYEHLSVESRACITAERAEFDRFIEALQQEIHAAEQEFFKTRSKSAPKV